MMRQYVCKALNTILISVYEICYVVVYYIIEVGSDVIQRHDIAVNNIDAIFGCFLKKTGHENLMFLKSNSTLFSI